MAAQKNIKRKRIDKKPKGRTAARRVSTARPALTPERALDTLRKHMLVDGFEIVVDLKRSKGSYIVDARDGKRYLDFFTFVASHPVGMNHPRMTSPAFLQKLVRAAVTKPSLSDGLSQA